MTFWKWIEYHILTELLKTAVVLGIVALVLLIAFLFWLLEKFVDWIERRIEPKKGGVDG
jgi:hypothetical protein